MHEMSLCEGIREIVEDHARRHDARRVSRVRVEVGRFSGVEKDALAFVFPIVMRGSVAEDATLDMIDLPGKAMCYDCIETVEIENRLDPCPKCGGGKLMPVSGDEMRVKDLEIV